MMKARKTSYRKYISISIVIILILLIAAFSFLRCFFIFLDGKLHRKDITVIRGVNVTSNNIREINLCTKLEELDIHLSETAGWRGVCRKNSHGMCAIGRRHMKCRRKHCALR